MKSHATRNNHYKRSLGMILSFVFVVAATLWAVSVWADKSAEDGALRAFSISAYDDPLEMSYHYIQIGWLEWAATHLTAISNDAPELNEAHVLSGIVWEVLGDYSSSREAFNRILAQESADDDLKSMAHVLLGMSLLKYSDLSEAKDHFLQALDQNDQIAMAHYGLGIVHAHENDTQASIHHLEYANELAPDWLDPVIWLASIYNGNHLYADAYALLRTNESFGFNDPVFQYEMVVTAEGLITKAEAGELTDDDLEVLSLFHIDSSEIHSVLTDQIVRSIERGIKLDPHHTGLVHLRETYLPTSSE